MIGANRVPKKKALRVRMLGEDLCVFKGQGQIYALTDICPHRGARLSEGDCHYDGTISCPYHGWVFDGEGRNVAVLSEGPNSIVCGKPGTEARAYPTKVLKGIVFVWMGDGEPAPIEEDVPEEFFRHDIDIWFNDHIIWHTNWEVALENSMDSHVQYLHRDNLTALLGSESVSPGGGSSGMRPIFTGNGFRGGGLPGQPVRRGNAGPQAGNGNGNGAQGQTPPGQLPPAMGLQRPAQAVYPQGWKWPKHQFRKNWASIFAPFFFIMRVESPIMKDPELWVGGHHLPGMFRAGGTAVAPPKPTGNVISRMLKSRGGGLYGLYTRQVVPIDEWKVRMWYHHSVVTDGNPWKKLWAHFVYFTWGRWYAEYNFSQQDMSVMMHQVYDAPEKLSGTDAEVVQWRKLVVTKHFGGRNHPFAAENPEPVAAPAATATTPAASS
jgi:phenylpropionate dioxygenase-like ring-hydroxylating dioxygenase large terminal subunit